MTDSLADWLTKKAPDECSVETKSPAGRGSPDGSLPGVKTPGL